MLLNNLKTDLQIQIQIYGILILIFKNYINNLLNYTILSSE